MDLTFDEAARALNEHGQGHVLQFWNELDERSRSDLLAQIDTLDLENVDYMRSLLAKTEEESAVAAFSPAPVVHLSESEEEEAGAAGDALLSAGRVGVLLVAGGQGTRLGFDGPKGAFPVAPISGNTLFAIHARKIAAMERKYGAGIPFYVMTSQANDAATRAFFEEHGCFGLAEERVVFFVQGMWPALTEDGKIILDRRDHIFMGPDGHGGVLAALRDRGVLADMAERGLEHVFYFQVDNPLVEIADPVFVGLHSSRDAEVSTKVCAKRDPEEGLGAVVLRGGRNSIVEYTELTDEQKHEVLPNGDLKFNFGSVAIHTFSRKFLEKEANARLPLHLAHKKVPYCNESGETVQPTEANAYKFEKFIFDSLPHADRWVNLVFARENEFSPVKNADGQDSPDTTRRDMMLKFMRMLEECGVQVPVDAQGVPVHRIEIDPLFALGTRELKSNLPAGFKVDGDVLLV